MTKPYKLKIITKEQEEILNTLFETLEITAEDLINVKNNAIRIEQLEEQIEFLNNTIEIQNKINNEYSDKIQMLMKEVNDIKTGKYNEKLNQVMAEMGLGSIDE